jgi:hypothetical protein
MLRSFDLEIKRNHENLETQEVNPFDYFLQSTAWLIGYLKHLSYNTAGNIMSTCVWQRYDPQYCLQSKLGLKSKNKKQNRKLSINPIKKKTRTTGQISYEYKVGDQALLETPGILRRLSTPCTEPYLVTNAYKNGTISIKKSKGNCIRKSEHP